MSNHPAATKARIRDATGAVLPPDVGVRVEGRPDGGSLAPRFDILVHTPAMDHSFVGGWAGEGWPADVERLVALAPDIAVVYAARLSEGSREWLLSHALGWIDEAGGANVSLSSGLIVSRDPRAKRPPSRPGGNWTGAMLTVAEAILAGVPPKVLQMEEATGLSRGSTVNSLSRLERQGLLVRTGPRRGPHASRGVAEIDRFIDDYAAAAGTFRAKQPKLLIHRLSKDPIVTLGEEIGPSLDAANVAWAVTGSVASTLLAPYLSDVTVTELYVDRGLLRAPDHLAQLVGGRIVDRGHRIEVREFPTPISGRGPIIDHIQVALPARVYADLMGAGGRAAEAAHHLRGSADRCRLW
jgi:hypothetical protein